MGTRRLLALLALAIAPALAWAHGPVAMGVLMMWDAILLVAGLTYLAAGPRPFQRRLVAFLAALAALVAAFFLVGFINPNDPGVIWILAAVAPIVVLIVVARRLPVVNTEKGNAT